MSQPWVVYVGIHSNGTSVADPNTIVGHPFRTEREAREFAKDLPEPRHVAQLEHPDAA